MHEQPLPSTDLPAPRSLLTRPAFCTLWSRGHAAGEALVGLEAPGFHGTWDEACAALHRWAGWIESELMEAGVPAQAAAEARAEACMLLSAELQLAGSSSAGTGTRWREMQFSFAWEDWSWHGRLHPVPEQVAVSETRAGEDGESDPCQAQGSAGTFLP